MVTPKFRVNYPNVFKSRYNELSKKDEYSVVAIFPEGTNLDALKDLAAKAMKKKFGEDASKWPANWKSPFKDAGENWVKDSVGNIVQPPRLQPGYAKGMTYMNLKSQNKPGVIDQNRQPIMDETQIYSGCFCRADVNASAYANGKNFGVSFWLNNLQKWEDGESLGGRMRAEEAFEPIAMPEGATTGAAPAGTAASLF